MIMRPILSWCVIVLVTIAASCVIAMACAGFALGAFHSGEVPSVDEVAMYSAVGIAAFSIPLSVFITLGVTTCGTTADDVTYFWPSSMLFVSAMAPAIGSAILDAPTATVSVLFSGCFVSLIVMVGVFMVSLLVLGLCVRCNNVLGWRWRSSGFDELDVEAMPGISGNSDISMHSTVTKPPHVPYVVVDHPGGELHVARPDEPPKQ